ncbi:deoxyribodipyrimidine photo-lyase/cryptochrome family protein [Hydrogenophaga sp.]|uniref:cryptochrome/deoxyribodipyrimidine photo-lyase family protein n=1 Tax=Hydrogenophaga sp. TaxID=1904254 RepID=UPI0025BBDDCC|nr:deoxyribodipyrimidine photo-lyase/cryptochrome family protein [Hydrogenophaga sp.]
MALSVVWFKRDLRVQDHAALAAAAARGPVLCLYVFEPSVWQQPDAATQHLHFVCESLCDLDQSLKALGARLTVVSGEVTEVLEQLLLAQPFEHLHSHEETGNGVTYLRDQAVQRWCRERGVIWTEWPQFGVVRRLRSRDGWARRWEAHVRAPQALAPKRLQMVSLPWAESEMPDAAGLGLSDQDPPQRQRGGRVLAAEVLHDFLNERSQSYRGGISSPLSAPTACSRLSPYLAHGCLSLREVVRATRERLAALPPEARHHRLGLEAFVSRLAWHCHFIQKLEDEPELEWRNLHRGYDGLREDHFNPAHFAALTEGRTGWPLVDACVAMLRETGWVNFRMRAMLVSVAAYPLWLHWRPVGEWLARQFLDYEPGIHWSQLQMQSGTTGINTTRVYNPIKQAKDHDPQGHFVRRWLPVLRRVPDAWLLEPWRMPPSVQARCGVRLGLDWPLPVVDLEYATREAKTRLHQRRALPEVKAGEADIVRRHGSRSRAAEQTGRTRSAAEAAQQSLF